LLFDDDALPLAAICIWALERRKWWVAGIAAADKAGLSGDKA
jgi:hypothetical protein